MNAETGTNTPVNRVRSRLHLVVERVRIAVRVARRWIAQVTHARRVKTASTVKREAITSANLPVRRAHFVKMD